MKIFTVSKMYRFSFETVIKQAARKRAAICTECLIYTNKSEITEIIQQQPTDFTPEIKALNQCETTISMQRIYNSANGSSL